jgi:hypothetical protein
VEYPFTLADTLFAVIPILCVQLVVFLYIFKKLHRKWMGYCIPVVVFVSLYLFWKGGVFSV